MKKTDDVYQNKMNETMMEDKEMQILKESEKTARSEKAMC